MLLFLVGVVTGLLVAFVVVYCLGHDIHRRLHEALWFGPDEPFHAHTHMVETGCTPELAPGTPILGGVEEGGVSYADLTPKSPNLEQVIANMVGPPKPVAAQPPEEPLEPQRPLPPIMRNATARRIAKERGVPVCRAAVIKGPGCTREGGPALTTAELLGFSNNPEGCAKVVALRGAPQQPVAPEREAEA